MGDVEEEGCGVGTLVFSILKTDVTTVVGDVEVDAGVGGDVGMKCRRLGDILECKADKGREESV